MKSLLLLFLGVSTMLMAQRESAKESAPASQGQTEPGKVVNPGQKIFEENCMRCHAANGSSNTFIGHKWNIPDLRSDVVQKLTPEQRITIITQGKGKMPAHKDKLTKDEIRLVESYVRELGKQQAATH